METVARITAVKDKGVGKVSIILYLVAIAGSSWLLTLDQVKTCMEEVQLLENTHADANPGKHTHTSYLHLYIHFMI